MNAAAPAFTLKGGHVLAILVGFFAVVIGIDVSFAVLAYRTDPGQVVDQPYEEGLAYNKALARRDKERAEGWRAQVSTQSAGVGNRRVRAVVTDAAGAPVRGLKLSGLFTRPATESGRRELPFIESAPGRYEASAPDSPGAWDLALRSADEARPFEAHIRLEWR